MSAEQNLIHSTGRGGAGNIGEDRSTYTAGDIVREGVQGESKAGDYSSGRGGAGNIVDASKMGNSADIVPDEAKREAHQNFHTGRGGEGNIHMDKYGGHSGPQKEHKEGHHESILDKAKHAIGLDHHKEK